MTFIVCIPLARATHATPNAEADSRRASGTFLVFDGLLYRGKPDLSALGMLPARGTGELWRPGQPKSRVDRIGVQLAVGCCRNFNGVFYLDVEHWHLFRQPDPVIDENIAKFIRMADAARAAAPDLEFGFYGVLPEIVYWPIVNPVDSQLDDWRRINRRTREIAQHVDVIFPSLYTFYADWDGWEIYARETLREARTYGKPVYAFLWPEYHDSNEQLRGQNLPREIWRRQLEFCRAHADGVVIWGGWQKKWDENAGWWQETKLFLQSLRETGKP